MQYIPVLERVKKKNHSFIIYLGGGDSPKCIAKIKKNYSCDVYEIKEPKKYKDFNKLRQYEEDMVLRPLLNTLCGHRDFDINIEDAERYNLDDD